jgi:hypothetical protein
VTFDLADVEANGGWLFEPAARTPTITPAVIPYGTILVDPNGWTVIVGHPEYDAAQYRLTVELDSRHGYYEVMVDDGYRAYVWQVGSSDPMTTDAVSPYGFVERTANPKPTPGWW